MLEQNISKLEMIAEGLGDILPSAVFTGSAVIDLYVTDLLAHDAHPFEVIELVIVEDGLTLYERWHRTLERNGFIREGDSDNWFFHDIPLRITGLSPAYASTYNRWYEGGIFEATQVQLFNGVKIKILPATYFVAIRLEEILQGGQVDLRLSGPFEEIVYVLDSRPELQTEIKAAYYEVRTFIQEALFKLVRYNDIEEAIVWNIPSRFVDSRIQYILNLIHRITGDKVEQRIS